MRYLLIILLTIGTIQASVSQFAVINVATPANSILLEPGYEMISSNLLSKIEGQVSEDEKIILSDNSELLLVCTINHNMLEFSNAGMLPVQSYRMELIIKVIDNYEMISYKEWSMSEEVVGNNLLDCTREFILNIRFGPNTLTNLISDAQSKRISYYSERCGDFVRQAQTLFKNSRYDDAIKLLSSIPIESDCFHASIEFRSIMDSLSQAKQDHMAIMDAYSEYFKGNYHLAVLYLKNVYNRSSDVHDVMNLIQKTHLRSIEHDQQKELRQMDIELGEQAIRLEQTKGKVLMDLQNSAQQYERELTRMQQRHEKTMLELDLKSKERMQIVDEVGNVLEGVIDIFRPIRLKSFKII